MAAAPNFDLSRRSRLRDFVNLRQAWFVGLLFATLIAAQALGFLLLGTGKAGLGLSESTLVLDGLLALTCAWIAFRRAQGITALFWFLFAAVLVVLLVPTALQAFDTLFDKEILSDSTRSLLYCVYGAPILMLLFLPETHRRARVKSEIFLDLFQIAIVVALIYSTFFFLPMSRMLPDDAVLRSISLSDAQSLLLLIAALLRLQFARVPDMRNLLVRLALFLLVCAIATFVGDWLFLHNATAGIWFDLGWAVPWVAAGLVAITWTPSPEPPFSPEPTNFLSFLGTNLALVALLSCTALLLDRWKQAQGATITSVAIGASLVAFTLRLALTQFHQQQEITRRVAAQDQLAASYQKIGHLLEGAHRQTIEITQISELGSLLQACTSREEVFRLIPERLRLLFPGASGCISLFSASRNRVESAAKWGVSPSQQLFSPDDCWALRRGRTHSHPGGHSAPRCTHLIGEGASVCIPLIANGAAFGTLSIQNDDLVSPFQTQTLPPKPLLAAANSPGPSPNPCPRGCQPRPTRISPPAGGPRPPHRPLQPPLHAGVPRARTPLRSPQTPSPRRHDARSRSLQTLQRQLRTLRRRPGLSRCRPGSAAQRPRRGRGLPLRWRRIRPHPPPECSLQQATVRAEEIRKRLQEYRAQTDGQATNPITVSIGVAAFDETTDRVDLLLKFADDALYQAKHGGRNRVVAARPAAALPDPNLTEADLATVRATETT